jgi:dTDP-4-dehydrorhamnose 3,5-epimerase
MKIHDVLFTPLKQVRDERGKVMHMLRATDGHFAGFGEIYFSTVEHGSIKAWKRHRRMTLNLACPVGQVRLVIFDDRERSSTFGVIEEVVLGPENYLLATIPPMLWTGFMGLTSESSLVANCASIPHDPAEADRCDPRSPNIPYEWRL